MHQSYNYCFKFSPQNKQLYTHLHIRIISMYISYTQKYSFGTLQAEFIKRYS